MKKILEIVDNHLLLIVLTIGICAGLYLGAITWGDLKHWISEAIDKAKVGL